MLIRMASITFENVTRDFPGTARPALQNLELAVDDGEFLVIVGPSGCGKTTTLRLLAGMDQPSSGKILLDGVDITGLDPRKRDTAMVFQNYALYPHMTVSENIGYPLKVAGVPTKERDDRVRQIAGMLHLEELLGRKPAQLSGGQQQRVAMGRALIRRPKAFLLDEPLSNLDASLRMRTRTRIKELASRLKITTLYVTHDQSEAMNMGDRVAVLRDGVLQQVAAPQEIYDRPANAFVAHFVGDPGMNLVVADVVDGSAVLGDASIRLGELAWPENQQDHSRVVLGVRPEDLRLVSNSEPGLVCEVVVVERHGGSHRLFCRSLVSPMRFVQHETVGLAEELSDQPPLFAVQPGAGTAIPAAGDRVKLAPHPGSTVHFFDPDSGVRLN